MLIIRGTSFRDTLLVKDITLKLCLGQFCWRERIKLTQSCYTLILLEATSRKPPYIFNSGYEFPSCNIETTTNIIVDAFLNHFSIEILFRIKSRIFHAGCPESNNCFSMHMTYPGFSHKIRVKNNRKFEKALGKTKLNQTKPLTYTISTDFTLVVS